MAKPQKRKIKLGELYFNLCKTLNDSFCGRSSYLFNTFSVYFLIAAAITLPITTGQAYFQDGWHIAIESIFFLFLIGFFSCVLLFYKKSAWHWCVVAILLVHYVSLADVIINNSSEFGVLYLGFVGVFFISYASWKSAKDVNRKGGLIDTVILAIGIACCAVGWILLQEQAQYGKIFIIVGVALVYIYAIARSLFWLVYTQERIKLSLIKTMLYVVFYLVLIIGLPFFLLWAGVEESILQNVIIPIYASILGGALALAGVAWTIKHGIIQKHEDELVKSKPLFTFNFFAEKEPLVNNRKVCLVEGNKQPTTIAEALRRPNGTESFMEIENSEQSSFTIKRFYFDGAWHGVSANNVVLPNTRLLVQLFREDTVTHPIMEIEDIFKRKFYYDLMFQFLLFPNEKITDKHKSTLGQMKEITEQDVVERGIKIGEPTNE